MKGYDKMKQEKQISGHVGPYRTVNLSKIIDPTTETRRCTLRRHTTVVQGVEDYHTDVDIMSHLGTHVEAPYHHDNLKKDVMDLPPTHYVGRGVLLRLNTCEPNALITRADLDAADHGRVQAGDVLILDSRYHSGPFVISPEYKQAPAGCFSNHLYAVAHQGTGFQSGKRYGN